MMLSNVTLRGRTVLPLTAHYIAPCHRAIEYLVPDEGQREGATSPSQDCQPQPHPLGDKIVEGNGHASRANNSKCYVH